jgi:hypothetical protein
VVVARDKDGASGPGIPWGGFGVGGWFSPKDGAARGRLGDVRTATRGPAARTRAGGIGGAGAIVLGPGRRSLNSADSGGYLRIVGQLVPRCSLCLIKNKAIAGEGAPFNRTFMARPVFGFRHICGTHGKLSFEHVPPDATFNDRRIPHRDFARVIGADGLVKGLQTSRSSVHVFSEVTFSPSGFVKTLCDTIPPNAGFAEISEFSRFEYNVWRAGISMRLPLMPIFTGFPGDYRTRD